MRLLKSQKIILGRRASSGKVIEAVSITESRRNNKQEHIFTLRLAEFAKGWRKVSAPEIRIHRSEKKQELALLSGRLFLSASGA
jgi:hypothetical protein